MLSEQAAPLFSARYNYRGLLWASGHVFVFIVLEVAELLSVLRLHACGAPSRVAAGRQAMIADLLVCAAFGIVMLFWSWGGLLGCRLK